ncbi:sialoadhesin [Mantella aurantiaca]
MEENKGQQKGKKTNMLKRLLLAYLCIAGVCSAWKVECPNTVKSVPGSCVYIPCTYDYPDDISAAKAIDKIWYKDYTGNRKTVYHPRDPPDSEFIGRVEFLGNNLVKNCTVLMKNIKKNDVGPYQFRFEIEDHNKWTDKDGVRIEVTDKLLLPEVVAPPHINEGASVTFQCSTPYFCPDGSVTLNWKDYTPERSFLSTHVRLDTTAVLMTQNLTTSFTWMEHKNKILCAVSVGAQTAVKEVTLDVRHSPKKVSVLALPSVDNIKQGDSVTLTCLVNSSNPAVSSYTWYKDSQQISQQPSLTFHSISRTDHGEYRCEVQNALGNGSSDPVRLIIFSARTEVSPSPNVKEGTPVTLTCDVPGVRPDEVQYGWYKNNILIKEGPLRSLVFHQAAVSDSGYYYCKVQNNRGSDSSPPVTLDILYPPRTPVLTSFLETQQGSLAMVHCTVNSNPFSELMMYKDGILIASPPFHLSPTQRIQATAAKNSLSLEIRDVTLSDEGTYSCLANNSVGSSTASVQLNVEVVRVVISPSGEVEEGKEVRLACVATRGSGKGTVYNWFKNEKWLKEDLKGNTLTFHSISAQDAGFYYCRAQNTEGSSTSPPVTLHVLYSPRQLSATSLVSSHYPLTAIILCTVDSKPPSQLFLYRKEILIASSLNAPSNERFKTLSYPNFLQLEIQDVVLGDEGIFTCTANNTYGSTTATLQLTAPTAKIMVSPSADVREGENVTLTCFLKCSSDAGNVTFSWYKNNVLLMEEQEAVIHFAQVTSSESGSYYCKAWCGESSKSSAPVRLQVSYAPRVIQLRSFQDTKEGRTAFIHCSVDSFPTAEVLLYRGDQLVASRHNADSTNERITVSAVRNALTLNINNIKMEDEGEYNCTARNSVGSLSEILHFNVQTARVLVSPSTEVWEGVPVTLTCDIMKPKLVEMEYVWYKNSRWLEKTNDNYLRFDSIKSSDSGYYHCLARDSQDSSTSPSVSLHVSYAPRRLVMSSFWEASGAQVGIVQCSVDSDPPSVLAVYYKSMLVGSSNSSESSSPRITISSAQNLLKVEIHEVMLEDEGPYACTATNSFGESKATVNFTAQTTRILVSPSSSVPEGEAVNMTCMVTSEASDGASYTWYKNGNKILIATNTLSFANPTSEDSGSYYCSVESRQGSKNSPAVILNILYAPRNLQVKSFLDTEIGNIAIILGALDSNPPAEMSLYKDGEMLASSIDGRTSSKRLQAYILPDTLRLEIHNIKTSDQGTYVFVAKNRHGMAQASVDFTVEGARVLARPSAELKEGDSLTLTCHVLDGAETGIGYTWYKNSRWLQEGAQASVFYKKVRSDDAGSYSCMAHSTGGSKTSPPVSITVLYPPRNLLMTSFLELQGRQLAVILCRMDSEPLSQLSLLKEGEVVSADGYGDTTHRITLSLSHNALRLEMKDVAMNDQGEYTCQANNSLGSAEQSIRFSVQTAMVVISPSSEVEEGHSVNLTCQAPITDNTTYIWYKNNKWLHESSQKSLLLPRVSSSDTGSYHCLAKHWQGNSVSPLVGISVLYGPRIPVVTSYLETQGRDRAIIVCRADSDPPSTIQLIRNDVQLGASALTPADGGDKYRSSVSHNYLKLEIGDVTAEDSGSYVCVVSNALGTTSSSIHLNTMNTGDSTYKIIFWVAAGCILLLIAVITGLYYWKKYPDTQLFRYSATQIIRYSAIQILSYSDNQILTYSDIQILSYSDNQILRYSAIQILSYSDNQILTYSDIQILSYSDTHILTYSDRYSDIQLLRYSDIQLLRYSDNQILTYSDTQIVRYSVTQIHRYSDTQIFRYTDTLKHRYSDTQILRYSDTQILRNSDSQILGYKDTQILRYTDTQIFKYSNNQILQYTDIQIHRYSETQIRAGKVDAESRRRVHGNGRQGHHAEQRRPPGMRCRLAWDVDEILVWNPTDKQTPASDTCDHDLQIPWFGAPISFIPNLVWDGLFIRRSDKS